LDPPFPPRTPLLLSFFFDKKNIIPSNLSALAVSLAEQGRWEGEDERKRTINYKHFYANPS
jgi:hypothetical protein